MTPLHFLLAIAFVALGSVLQAATGLGAGLIVIPLLTFISIQFVPGPYLFGSLALSAAMAWAGRRDIERKHLLPVLSGVLGGSVVAAFLMAGLPLKTLGLVFGVLIIAMVVISVIAPRMPFTTAGCLGAGALSGFCGTSAGIGAPILALLYQHFDGPRLRATLAFLYFCSSVAMVALLFFAGRFGRQELVYGTVMVPGFLLGYFAAPRLARYFDKGRTRPAVLVLSAVSALVLIWRSL